MCGLHVLSLLWARSWQPTQQIVTQSWLGGYYIEAVQRLGGCPRVVRGTETDLGTENCFVRDFQRFLVPADRDGTLDSYLEGASTAKQRIEYWWGFLRRQYAEFWLSLFADLRDNRLFDGGFLDKSPLLFCMGLIQVSWWVFTILTFLCEYVGE